MAAVTVLPDAPWRHMAGIGLIHSVLGSDEAMTRIVGGAVRDGLAGQPVKDIDLATRFTPDEVIARLKHAGVKTVPTGIAHGTVTAVIGGGNVEITTLRRDVTTDGRRATIAYTDDWQEDAARRDFTINALYADPASGAVYDYFGGVDDLNAGIVRFIGDPLQRIAEDHLRILRFFRFGARYGKGAVDQAALMACAARANDLMALSRERIADELIKILTLVEPVETLKLMLTQGILKPVLPEIGDVKPLAALIAIEPEAKPEPIRRLAALIAADQMVANGIAKRLKLSKMANKRLINASKRTQNDRINPYALAYRLGTEYAVDRLLLLGDTAGVAIVSNWPIPVLPITGGALVKRGISAGPEVARILKMVEARWIEEGFPTAARVDAIADMLVKTGYP